MKTKSLYSTDREYKDYKVYQIPVSDSDRNTRPGVIFNCNYCGKPNLKRLSEFKKYKNNYCNQQCLGKMHAKKNRGFKQDLNPAYKGKLDYITQLKKESSCSNPECSESRAKALCFHHREPEQKELAVSRMKGLSQYTLEHIKKEVEKCDILCQNCHKVRHSNPLDSKEGPEIPDFELPKDNFEETLESYNDKKIYRKKDQYRKKHIIRKCNYCGQKYFSQLSCFKQGRHKYHSQLCAKRDKLPDNKVKKDRLKSYVSSIKKGNQCEKCGESRFQCLEFHHVNPQNKTLSISNMISRNYSKSDLEAEIQKCTLICRNCHQVKHS